MPASADDATLSMSGTNSLAASDSDATAGGGIGPVVSDDGNPASVEEGAPSTVGLGFMSQKPADAAICKTSLESMQPSSPSALAGKAAVDRNCGRHSVPAALGSSVASTYGGEAAPLPEAGRACAASVAGAHAATIVPSKSCERDAANSTLDPAARAEAERQKLEEFEQKLQRLERERQHERQLERIDENAREWDAESEDLNRRSIYVGGLDGAPSAEELQRCFQSCGTILRITPLMGHAFVEFKEPHGMQNALLLHGTEFQHRHIKVVQKVTKGKGKGKSKDKNKDKGKGKGKEKGKQRFTGNMVLDNRPKPY